MEWYFLETSERGWSKNSKDWDLYFAIFDSFLAFNMLEIAMSVHITGDKQETGQIHSREELERMEETRDRSVVFKAADT